MLKNQRLFFISFITIIFAFSSSFSATVVEPSNNSLFILLNTVYDSKATLEENKCWNDDLKDYIQSKVVGLKGHVYCATYDMSQMPPVAYANELAVSNENILTKALDYWYNNTDNPFIQSYKKEGWSFARLKKDRKDLLPLRYVIIANGASGLAVREYIQGSQYEGEISNVLFFNTPHEGTGFADQALFSKKPKAIEKKQSASSIAALIPLALTAYVAGGIDGLRDVMISLAKDAVIGMATSFAQDAQKALNQAYFVNLGVDNPSLWYLTQDADEDDPTYSGLISDAGVSASIYLGGTQLLNSFSKTNAFDHPLYNVVYSDGFPTIGNGRRTLADYVEQNKNHISKEKLKSIIADSLSASLSAISNENGAYVEEIKSQLKELASQLIEGELSERAKNLASSIVDKYGSQVEQINSVLKDEKLSGYLKGLSELRSIKWNKDDIPGNVLKILSVVEKFIPDEYKSELYSVFIENFSTETASTIKNYGSCVVGGKSSLRDCARKGLKTAAENLANYSLNFFDGGTFDVSQYSAFGKNVTAFKESTTRRFGYAIDEIVAENKDSFRELSKYQEKLNSLGELEQARIVVDVALDIGCGVLEKTIAAYGKVCRAAEFAVNVGLMAESSIKIKKIAENVDALSATKDVALWAAMKENKVVNAHRYNGDKYTASFSDLDSMLYSAPIISIASVLRPKEGSADSIVPLMLTKECNGDVYDYSSLQKACDFTDADLPYRKLIHAAPLEKFNFGTTSGKRTLPVKYVSYKENENNNLRRLVSYGAYEYFVTDDFLSEFRFQIDDVSPDSLRLIKFEFSSGARMAYERGEDNVWRGLYGEDTVLSLDKSPVKKNGLFVFHPEEILEKAGTVLAAAEEDGLNIVNVYVVNKLGLSDSRQFSFFFQATDPLLEEGWPKNYGIVSAIENAYVNFGNVGYPIEAKHGGVRISKMENGSVIKLDSVEAVITNSESAGTFVISADLHSVFNKKLSEGEYLLEWDVAYAYTDGSSDSELKSQMGVVVYVDTTAPKLKWNVPNRRLRGVSSEGRWAVLESVDEQSDMSIRAMRAYLVGGADSKDTVKLYERNRVADRYYQVSWPDSLKNISGLATLHVQAYDFSNPSESIELSLQNISTDSLTDFWSIVLDEHGNFISGINGTDISVDIWIDRTSPQIENGSLNVEVLSRTFDELIGGKSSTEDYILNLYDSLKLSFDVREDFGENEDSSVVRVDLIFKNLLNGVERVFSADSVTKTSVFHYEFIEPDANRLLDGVYQVVARLRDLAGNIKQDTIVQRLVVDRTAPVVAGVYSGDVAFANVSSLKSVTGYVEQKMDLAQNRSDLSCYSKIHASGVVSEWRFLGIETESKKTDEEKKLEFDFDKLTDGFLLPDGNWTVYLRCYDAAGNFGENIDFFGMGARYPQITSPGDSVNTIYYGEVIVSGYAPNPAIQGGNNNDAEYRIDWKRHDVDDENAWTEDSVAYLVSGVHTQERALAVWRIPKEERGLLDLRLSVRSCRDDALCPWVSSIREIPVYDRSVEGTLHKPRFNFVHIPERQGKDERDSVVFELLGVADTAKWTVKVSIDVQSPENPQKMVSGLPVTFNPVVVSPFAGKPSVLKDGLNIWRDSEKNWNVVWRGNALGLKDSLRDDSNEARLLPTLRLKYQKKNISFDAPSDDASEYDNALNIEAMDVGNIRIPGYDEIALWNLNGSDISVRFKTDSAFTIDLSTVENGDSLIFCGEIGRPSYEIASASYGNAVLYVFPERYLAHVPFDGLTQTGLYPGGENVKMSIYAYNNHNLNQVVVDSSRWLLTLGQPELVTTVPDSGVFFLGIGDSDDEEGSALTKQKLGFSYGLKGRSARVSAWITGPDGSIVKNLMTKENKLAGSDPQAFSLDWDGMTNDNFASMKAGHYKLHIEAYDLDDNVVSELCHNFELKYATSLVEAPDAVDGSAFAELSMDEAVEESGELRFVGNPDYLMRIKSSAKHLPESERTFDYKWEWDPENKGTQYPMMYKTYRPSLGIWRQRDKFETTVAVLVMSYSYGLTDYPKCNPKNRSLSYMVKLEKKKFEKGASEKYIDFSFDPEGRSIIAYDKGDYNYPIVAAVKILPVYEYQNLFEKYFNSKNVIAGNIDYDDSRNWEKFWISDIWGKDEYKQGDENSGALHDWFNNWGGKTIYWEGRAWNGSSYMFWYNTPSVPIVADNLSMYSKDRCPISLESDADGDQSTCDEEDDKSQKGTYNPHADMLSVRVVGTGTHGAFGQETNGDIGMCGGHGSSLSSIVGKVYLGVKDSYWKNSDFGWGYNNLANRYVRFDPTNKTLFDSRGYFGEENAPSTNKYNAAENRWEKCIGKEDCYPTAFETLKLEMTDVESNSLLFPDEKPVNRKGRSFSLSRYWLNFFNASDNYLAVMKTKNSQVGLLKKSDSYNYKNPKKMGDKYNTEPMDVVFEVAPLIEANEALAVSNASTKGFDYPYTKGVDSFKKDFESNCPGKNNYRCYGGFASRIHYGIGDWSDNEWTSKYLVKYEGDDYIRNSVVSSQVDKKIANVNEATPVSANTKDSVYRYKLDDYSKIDALGRWTASIDDLSRISKFKSVYGKPVSGELIPTVICSSSSTNWSVDSKKCTSKECNIVNSGVDSSSVLEYIYSKDESQKFDRMTVAHNVNFKSVLAQNPYDSIFTSPWFQNQKVEGWKLYRRDSTDKEHPYLDVEYNNDGTTNYENSVFNVSQKDIPFNTRVEEIATLRGRVPGENMDWKLFYTKNGMIFPIASGTQNSVPMEKPYTVLDYVDVNRLQGNTSFFLTYGGSNDATYFRQLDVHIGTVVNPDSSMEVHSMYGNISVNFPAGTWGENAVDVTVRTISLRDYNFSAFQGLDIVGPVVEVLPSHVFGDSTKLPEVKVMILKSTIKAKNLDASNLKIYKPNFETGEIVALETDVAQYYNGNSPVEKPILESGKENWDRVWLKAVTKSFSTFFVMDSDKASKIVLRDSLPTSKNELICGSMPMDSLWAGTANGWLEYHYPCSGKSNYLIQLRQGADVVAEHQGISANPIVWYVRNGDINVKGVSYDSRAIFYGVDGNTVEMRGPSVRIDSVAPRFDGDADVVVSEDGSSRILQVEAAVSDIGSGISKTRFDLYFGGNLLETRTVLADSVFTEQFAINRDALYSCVGCRATIAITTEDYGHNYAKASIQSETLFPYPTSLALWYPLGEGVGDIGYEMTGSGLNLGLKSIPKRWMNGKQLHLYSTEYATSEGVLMAEDLPNPFSIELKATIGRNLGEIAGWDGSMPWTVGVDSDRRFYLECSLDRITFATKAEFAVENHLVWTVDGNQVVLYKNGELMERRTLLSNLTWLGDGRPVVGKFSKNGITSGFTGYISDVRFYRSALTKEQVSSLYRDGLDLDAREILVARAVNLNRDGLVIDQSCGIAGKAYLRQKNTSSIGTMTWNVNVDADNYALYVLMRGYASEKAYVEVFVNGASCGVFSLTSTGFWESRRIGNLNLDLASGENAISLRPSGNLGIAGVAIVSASNNLPADKIDYGEGGWESPTPRVAVKMNYSSPNERTWARMQFQIANLTGERFSNTRIRYYYKGEGESVGSQVFNPYGEFVSINPDAGSVYYGELTLNQAIDAHGSVYDGNGPFFGLYRIPNNVPWDIKDDPSYDSGAETAFVNATGVALLDEDGNLLNEWNCHDEDGAADIGARKVRALVSDEKFGSSTASTIKLVVENVGNTVVNGFEARYYFRDVSGKMAISVYDKVDANVEMVNAGGNLYYVSVLYPNTILNPGEKTVYGNGAKFEIYHADNSHIFDVTDDPSYHGISGYEQVEADSVVILDLSGNLLWGHAPSPTFDVDYPIAENTGEYIYRDGEIIYVNVSSRDSYVLQVVNAAGLPMATLFNGTWNEGEHAVNISDFSLSAECYLVLRRGSRIITWQLLK